jgi:NAD dependent epimerase/dehydratase
MKIEGKSILVTGADGFIGSHLVEALVERGVDVTALSYYNSFNYWGWLETLDRYYLDAIYVKSGDIRDRHFIGMITHKIDVIFHLAALIAIPYSYLAPDSYVETNVKGTMNICHAALEHQCERVVHVSTSEVYGTARYVPINEDHPLQAQSPYSASKIGADAIATSFCRSYDVPVVIARPFNTYGPRQSARAIIPTIISQIAAGEKEIKLGNLSPTRDFNYVKDTVQGLIQLAECDRAVGDVVNIGSNTEISIKELVELIKKLMNSDAAVKEDKVRFRPGTSEVEQLLCDNAKIKRLTGYTPQYTLEQGLQETIQWIEKNLEKYKIRRYNM